MKKANKNESAFDDSFRLVRLNEKEKKPIWMVLLFIVIPIISIATILLLAAQLCSSGTFSKNNESLATIYNLFGAVGYIVSLLASLEIGNRVYKRLEQYSGALFFSFMIAAIIFVCMCSIRYFYN